MNFFKFGFIDFFGILAPGVILLFNMIALAYAILGTSNWGQKVLVAIGKSPFLESCQSIGSGWILLSVFLLIVCYLFGFILRLMRPDFVDRITRLFLKLAPPWKYFREKAKIKKEFYKSKYPIILARKGKLKLSRREKREKFKEYLEEEYYPDIINKKKNFPSFLWLEEKFPYYWYLKYNYCIKFPTWVFPDILNDKKHFNTNTYNYFKLFLSFRNPEISAMIYQTEAYIRFICGSFWALLIGFFAGAIIIINCVSNINTEENSWDLMIVMGVALTLLTAIMLIIIMLRFKNQRKREVKMVIDGVIITAEKKEDLKIFDGKHTQTE